MVLAVFSAIATAFLLGDKIGKNLDAWLRLARRFNGLLTKLKEKFGAVRIDESGAQLVALLEISQTGGELKSMEAVSLSAVPVGQFHERDPKSIDSRSDALYIQVFLVNDEHLYVVGLRSSGRVDFVRKYGADWYDFDEPAT